MLVLTTSECVLEARTGVLLLGLVVAILTFAYGTEVSRYITHWHTAVLQLYHRNSVTRGQQKDCFIMRVSFWPSPARLVSLNDS